MRYGEGPTWRECARREVFEAFERARSMGLDPEFVEPYVRDATRMNWFPELVGHRGYRIWCEEIRWICRRGRFRPDRLSRRRPLAGQGRLF